MVDAEINEYVDTTKGERVNELLKRAMLAERYGKLEAEAAAFFSRPQDDRSETKPFQDAAVRAFVKD
jgi:hypothetical protein